jgi:hypothetical protein
VVISTVCRCRVSLSVTAELIRPNRTQPKILADTQPGIFRNRRERRASAVRERIGPAFTIVRDESTVAMDCIAWARMPTATWSIVGPSTVRYVVARIGLAGFSMLRTCSRFIALAAMVVPSMMAQADDATLTLACNCRSCRRCNHASIEGFAFGSWLERA